MKQKQSSRIICWTPSIGLLMLQSGKQISSYWVQRLESDFGQAYRLEKANGPSGGFDAGPYDVLLNDEDHHSCDCIGHLRWGTYCRHICAMLQLRANSAPIELAGEVEPVPF